jgi:hypothetical protein
MFRSRAVAKVNPAINVIISPIFGIGEMGDVEVMN